jgi:hypothetical protein
MGGRNGLVEGHAAETGNLQLSPMHRYCERRAELRVGATPVRFAGSVSLGTGRLAYFDRSTVIASEGLACARATRFHSYRMQPMNPASVAMKWKQPIPHFLVNSTHHAQTKLYPQLGSP